MTLALATKHFDQLNDLLARKIEHIDFQLVDRSVCEQEDSGWVQLIPYSSISCYDPMNGDIKFLAYQNSEGEGEQRQVHSTHLGFGNGLVSVDDITCESMDDVEGVGRVYHMTVADLLQTCLAVSQREWVADIGFDPVTEFGINVAETVKFSFFRDPNATEQSKSFHLGLDIPLTVSPEQLVQTFQNTKLMETQSKDLKEFVLNAGQILLSFDVSEVGANVINRMTAEHKVAPWSVQVIGRRLTEYVEMIRNHIGYGDIILAVKRNVETMRAEAEKANAALNQQVLDQNPEGQDTVDPVPVAAVDGEVAAEAIDPAAPAAEQAAQA